MVTASPAPGNRAPTALWLVLAALALCLSAMDAGAAGPPTLGGNLSRFFSAQFLDADRLLVELYNDDDQCVCVFSLPRSKVLFRLEGDCFKPRYSRAHQAIIGYSALRALTCWDAKTGKRRWSNSKIGSLRSWALNDKEVAALDGDDSVLLLDWRRGAIKSRIRFRAQADETQAVLALSPQGKIATGSILSRLNFAGDYACGRLVSRERGGKETPFAWTEQSITRMAYAMGERCLITLNGSRRLRAWDAGTGRPAGGGPGRVPRRADSFTLVGKDAGTLVIGCGGWVELYSLATGKASARGKIADTPIQGLAASPDGKGLIAITHMYALRLVSVKGLRVERTISALDLHRQLSRMRAKR